MTSASGADSIAEFAAALRALRLEAGSPTLSRLQHDTRISRTVLSEAFIGKRLPSARTVDALARVLNADGNFWVRRRDALAAVLASPAAAEAGTDSPSSTPSSPDQRTIVMVGALAFAVGALLSAVASAVRRGSYRSER